MRSTATPLHSASAVFASRADTPIRKLPVTSLIKAQRPVGSSASSHGASSGATSARPARRRLPTISASPGTGGEAPLAVSGATGQISDTVSARSPTKIVRPAEQFGINPRGGEGAHLVRLGFGKGKFSGQRGKRPAAVGIGFGGEILAHQAELAGSRRGQQQRFEQGGKAVHSSSSKPIRVSARAR